MATPLHERITAVVAGQQVAVVFHEQRRRTLEGMTVPRSETRPVTIKAPCDDKKNGHWYCVTHGEGFEHQLAKDNHIHAGEHLMAWVCNEHGLEAP